MDVLQETINRFLTSCKGEKIGNCLEQYKYLYNKEKEDNKVLQEENTKLKEEVAKNRAVSESFKPLLKFICNSEEFKEAVSEIAQGKVEEHEAYYSHSWDHDPDEE